MNRPRAVRIALIALAAVVLVPTLAAQQEALEEGIDAFARSDFQTALLRFREVLLEQPDRDSEATAYFWLAKSAMALNRLNEAERNLEYYLREFPRHTYAVEAEYQRGRLLYMQEDFTGALRALAAFVEDHPDSPFVANATYWSAEALFSVGRLQEARRLFQTVIQDYPSSFRVEAARYRVAVIDLNQREQELLDLLRWSHEEYLRVLEDARRRERTYEQAIAGYQNRLQDAATEDFRDEIVRLSTQVRSLQETIRSRDEEILRLREQLTTLRNDLGSLETGAAPSGDSATNG